MLTRERIDAIKKREQRKLRARKLKWAKEYLNEAESGFSSDGEPADVAWCLQRADQLKTQAEAETYLFPLKYYPRLNVFKSTNCGWNPETGEGHSYEWYTLAKVINGVQVLNSFRYSKQTSDHVWSLRSTFRVLGVKYVEVEAPRGLQNLDAALSHCLKEKARQEIRNKYARKRQRGGLKYWDAQIELLKSFGVKGATKAAYAEHLEAAGGERRDRLDRQKAMRAERKAINAIEVIHDELGTMHGEAGWHVISPWYTDRSIERFKIEARDRGHSKVYVHKEEPKPVRPSFALIQGGLSLSL